MMTDDQNAVLALTAEIEQLHEKARLAAKSLRSTAAMFSMPAPAKTRLVQIADDLWPHAETFGDE
jgi:hypothetical protein